MSSNAPQPASQSASQSGPGLGPQRISFLGPFGTFTEQALRQVAPAGATLLPVASSPKALDLVRQGEADRAVVPIENSIEGGVNSTLDALAHGQQLLIVREMVVDVTFQLAVRPGTTARDIHRIGTHSHAWAQCHQWVERTFPGAVHIPTSSTASAAQQLGAGEADFDAALCNITSVTHYGLESLFSDVADHPGAVTRFIMVARPGHLPPPTGADKTTIQAALPYNGSGALLMLLEQFAVRGVDLSRIESRPNGDGLGQYDFSIDIVGHIREERVKAALVGLHRVCPRVRFMGSYPRVDQQPAAVMPGTTDQDFANGRAWVESLLNSSSVQ